MHEQCSNRAFSAERGSPKFMTSAHVQISNHVHDVTEFSSKTMADDSVPVTFRKYFTTIVTGIQSSVVQVATKCYERGLIVKSELIFINNASEVDTYSKAQTLLMSIEDSIKINEARFDTFVEILEEEPAYEDLVRILRDGAGRIVPQEEGSNVSTLPSRSVSQFSSKARLISANPDSSFNPRVRRRALSDSGGIQSGVKEWGYVDEGEPVSCQESSSIHLPNSDVYFQSFQKLGGDVAALKREENEIEQSGGETISTDVLPVVEKETSSSFQSEDQSDSLADIAADLTNVSKKLIKKDVEGRLKDARIEDLVAKEKERREQLEEAIRERNLMEMKLKEKDRETEKIKLEKDLEIKALKSQFEKKGEEVAKYKRQLAEKERQNLQMKQEYQDRISKLETQQAETKKKYERQIRDLENSAKEQQKNKELELAKMEKELAKMEKELALKEAEYQKLLAARYKEAGELQEKIRDLEIKEKTLEVELEREKRKNAEMRVEMNVEAHRQSISSLQQEHQEAIEMIRKECNDKIEVHRSEKDAQIQQLTEELSRLSSQNSQDSTTQ